MSDIKGKIAEWRKTVWGIGPCPDSSQENFTLTDEEREAIEVAVAYLEKRGVRNTAVQETLRGLLARTK